MGPLARRPARIRRVLTARRPTPAATTARLEGSGPRRPVPRLGRSGGSRRTPPKASCGLLPHAVELILDLHGEVRRGRRRPRHVVQQPGLIGLPERRGPVHRIGARAREREQERRDAAEGTGSARRLRPVGHRRRRSRGGDRLARLRDTVFSFVRSSGARTGA